MAEPWEFMQRVVAWPGPSDPGYVNLHFMPPVDPARPKKGGMRGRPFRDLTEFMGMAQWCTSRPDLVAHTYFCLSTQKVTGRVYNGKVTAARSAQQALHLKAIWLDIDVKPEKGYPTVGAALVALTAFVAEAKLPPCSALVFSGGGIHVYWISDRPLTVQEWRPYAEGLKAEAQRLGLKCDYGLTTDPARVLRIPGTTNGKTTPAKAVALKHLGEDYDFGSGPLDRLASVGVCAASVNVTAPVTLAIPAAFAGKGPHPLLASLDPQADKLSDGINTHDDRPLDPDQIVLKCPHIQDACLTHGAGYPQGLWMLDVLAATFMEDGRTWAHYMSSGYSAYSKSDTDAMYDRKEADKARGIGWPSCRAFENEGSKHCAGCPMRGIVKSPLNLAERFQPPTIPLNTVPPPPADLDLPDGYTVDTDKGYICKIVDKKVPGGNGLFEQVLEPIFKCRTRAYEARSGERHGLAFQCEVERGNWVDVFVPQEIMSTTTELWRQLNRQKVKPHPRNKVMLEDFLMSFMEKMDFVKKRLAAVPYGWVVEDGVRVGFAYGGKVARKDGTMTSAGIPDGQIERQFRPTGNPEPWFKVLKIITDQHHPALEAIVALSFAAPLMWVPRLYNCVLCARSDGSGAHKTTSITAGLAVWGSPQLSKENAFSTGRGLMHKLSELKNLPVYVDEVNSDAYMAKVQAFLTFASEGRGPTRLTQDIEFRDVESWQSLICVGANVSLWDALLKESKNTDAKLQRVFEFEVEKRGDTGDPFAIQQLVGSLDDNYGHMGMRYAKYLADNVAEVSAFTEAICEDFYKDVHMQSPERHRAALCGTMIAGASLANGLGATFNLKELYAFLKTEFLKQRDRIMKVTTVGGTRVHTSDVLAHFMISSAGHVLWTDTMPTKGRPAPVKLLGSPERNDASIFIRCAVDKREIAISRTAFSAFVDKYEYPLATLQHGLEAHLGARSTRMDLTAGTLFTGGREPVLVIPVPDPTDTLGSLLYKHTPAAERPVNPVDPVPEIPPLNGLNMVTGATGPGHVPDISAELVETAAAVAARDVPQASG